MFGKAYVDKVNLCCCVLVQVAVHCHAGLGRTGVLMACYLVYYLRVRSNDALRYVRLKRPNAVQTRKQIDCVKEFEAFFLPQCVIFRYTVTFRSVSLTLRSSQGALHLTISVIGRRATRSQRPSPSSSTSRGRRWCSTASRPERSNTSPKSSTGTNEAACVQ